MKLCDFENVTWSLTRVINDHRQKAVTNFAGTAVIAAGTYQESGRMTLANGQALQSTRRYLWRDTASGIEVCFQDGSYFHTIPKDAAHGQAAHFCDPDQYDVAYDFSTWPEWTATWTVIGPQKDYKMVSIYRP